MLKEDGLPEYRQSEALQPRTLFSNESHVLSKVRPQLGNQVFILAVDGRRVEAQPFTKFYDEVIDLFIGPRRVNAANV